MAELAIAIFSGIGSAVSSAGAALGLTEAAGGVMAAGINAASTVPAVGGGSLFGGSSLLTGLLQGGVSVLGAMSAMREGEEKSRALKAQAADAEFDAKQAELAGLQKSDALRRQLLAEQGERDVAAAASGIDLSFGTPAIARQQAAEDSMRALALEGDNTQIKASRYLERASSYKQMAASARQGGLTKGLSTLGGTALSIARRG